MVNGSNAGDAKVRAMPDSPKPAPTPAQLERYAQFFNGSKAMRYLGATLSFPSSDRVLVTLDAISPEMRGGLGTSAVNGAVLAGLFDLAIGCTPALIDPTRRTATIQLSMSFERAVTGNRITVEAGIDSAGGSTIFSSARLFDEAGNVCARCQGVCRMSNKPWESTTGPLT